MRTLLWLAVAIGVLVFAFIAWAASAENDVSWSWVPWLTGGALLIWVAYWRRRR